MIKATVFDIQKFSVHDGPGIRTIVFFKGCPLNCQWCANPESQRFAPDLLFFPDKCIGCGKCIGVCQKNCIVEHNGDIEFYREDCNRCLKCTEVCSSQSRVKSGTQMNEEEIISEIDKDIVFYEMSGGGVTFSGGESMCHSEMVESIAKHYKQRGISTAMETCGYVSWEDFEKVLPYIDVLLFDLKLMDSQSHSKYIGYSNELILENLRNACKMAATTVRIPIIPTINDSVDDINAFGEFLSTIKDDIDGVNILPYHDFGIGKYTALGRPYLLNDIKAPEDEHMAQIKERLASFGLSVKIGG